MEQQNRKRPGTTQGAIGSEKKLKPSGSLAHAPGRHERGSVGYTATGGATGMTIEEVLQKDMLNKAFLASYTLDEGWILGKVQPTTRLAIVRHYDTRKDKAGTFKVTSGSHTLHVIHPPLPPFAAMHTKMLLLYYPTHLRLVITSANLVREDWIDTVNCIFVQDFPKKAGGEASTNQKGENFSGYLTDIMTQLQAPQMLRASLSEYDYSQAAGTLVASVPGRYPTNPPPPWAMPRLHSTIKKMPEATSLVYQASTLGGLTAQWLWSLCRPLLSADTTKAQSALPPLSIVFPTTETVEQSTLGPLGGQVILLSAKNATKSDFPKSLLHHCLAQSPGRLLHSKMLIGYDKETPQWVYLGSHNLTAAAWGKEEKAGSQLHVNNFELGIVLPGHVITSTGLPFASPCPYDTNDLPWVAETFFKTATDDGP